MTRPRAAALALALGLDLAAGEPPGPWHPVAWLGRALGWAEAGARRRGVLEGGVALLAVTAVAAGAAAALAALARRTGRVGLLVEGLALKPAFAGRRLAEAAGDVERALGAGDLEEARRRLGRDLVSRDTVGLTAAQVTSAAVESVAENLTDSVTAPLLAYAVGGLPAAWAYRALNTADAMWGYRGPRYERFGKVAARLDDGANLLAAPLAAAALGAGAGLVGEDAAGAFRTAWRDHGRTASPNAGWPMAAMAGALGVGLEKPGHYRLGAGELPASPRVIRRAVRVFAAAGALTAAVALGLAARRGAGPAGAGQ